MVSINDALFPRAPDKAAVIGMATANQAHVGAYHAIADVPFEAVCQLLNDIRAVQVRGNAGSDKKKKILNRWHRTYVPLPRKDMFALYRLLIPEVSARVSMTTLPPRSHTFPLVVRIPCSMMHYVRLGFFQD